MGSLSQLQEASTGSFERSDSIRLSPIAPPIWIGDFTNIVARNLLFSERKIHL